MSDSLQPHGLCPPGSSVHGDSPGKNTGVGYHDLLQGIFPNQGLNLGLPQCRWILYYLSLQGSPFYLFYHLEDAILVVPYNCKGNLLLSFFTFIFWNILLCFRPHSVACRILVPQPRIKPSPLALEVQSPNHWITREFPATLLFAILCKRKYGEVKKVPWTESQETDFPLGQTSWVTLNMGPWSTSLGQIFLMDKLEVLNPMISRFLLSTSHDVKAGIYNTYRCSVGYLNGILYPKYSTLVYLVSSPPSCTTSLHYF